MYRIQQIESLFANKDCARLGMQIKSKKQAGWTPRTPHCSLKWSMCLSEHAPAPLLQVGDLPSCVSVSGFETLPPLPLLRAFIFLSACPVPPCFLHSRQNYKCCSEALGPGGGHLHHYHPPPPTDRLDSLPFSFTILGSDPQNCAEISLRMKAVLSICHLSRQ